MLESSGPPIVIKKRAEKLELSTNTVNFVSKRIKFNSFSGRYYNSLSLFFHLTIYEIENTARVTWFLENCSYITVFTGGWEIYTSRKYSR